MPANYGPILTKFNQIEIQENAWLWPGRIPLGAITTLIGFGGEGKSFLACSVACAVSRGAPLPDGAPAPLGNVVVMAGEDLPSKLRLRYEANGADLDRVTLLEGQRIYTKTGPVETNLTLRDIDLIREAVDKTENVKLLIIDPIGDFIPGINSDKDNEVRSLLNPLAQLAKDKGLAVLLICHRKKGAGDRADNAALGSVAFTAKARAVHHVILDPHDTAHPSARRRLFLPGKLNDEQQTKGLAFKIAAPQGILQWETEPIEPSADAILSYAAAKSRAERAADPTCLADAEAWLKEALKDIPRLASDLAREARAEGIAPRTLRRAKQTLGIAHTRTSRLGAYLWHIGELASPSQSAGATPIAGKLAGKLTGQTVANADPARPATPSENELASKPATYHPAFPPPRLRNNST